MKPTHLVPPLAFALLVACSSGPSPAPDGHPPYTVDFGPDVVSLSIAEGSAIPMTEFVKIAQRVTGRILTYRADDLTGDDTAVRFVGTMKIPNEDFYSFFQTMLYVHGLACTARGEGDVDVVEIVRLPANG